MRGGFDFVCRVSDTGGPSYLEEMSGLTAFQEEDNAKFAEIEYFMG